MTTNDFFVELERIHDRFQWTLVPDGGPVSERRTRPRLHLRATPKDGSVNTVFDPLGAVCYARTSEVYEPQAWSDAGEVLGMTPGDAAALVAASNDRTWTGPAGGREPLPTLIAMRVRLIETVGLSVKTS